MSLTVKIEGGTPNLSKPSLCNNCKHAHRMQGERTSDFRVFCEAMYEHPFEVKTKVVSCSNHRAIKDQSLSEMQKIGYILETRKGKPIGFVSRAEHMHKTKRGEDSSDVDVHDDDY